MGYSSSNKREKNDTTVAFYIKLSKYGLSEIDITYTDVSIIYSVLRSYNGKYTSYRSVLHETDLFDMIREDLWYMEEHVLEKIIELSEEEIKNELNCKDWIYEDFLSIQIDIEEVKESL
jgi:hypothetical protein